MSVAATNGRAKAGPNAFDAPPHSIEAEKALLGSYLLRPELLSDPDAAVSAEDFYLDRHRAIYAVVRALDAAGAAPDAVTIGEKLRAGGSENEWGGEAYLLELMQAAPHAGHGPHYAGIVRERSARRRVIAQARRIAAAAGDVSADFGEALAAVGDIGEAAGVPRVRLISSREFDDADMDVEFLANGFIVRGQPMIGGGPAKGGKTITVASAIVNGAAGEPILGKFAVPRPFRSAFISMESGGAAIRATVRSQCHAIGRRLSDLDGMVFWQLESLKLSEPATLTALRREIERKQLDFLCVDPLYLALELEADDEKSIYKMGRRLGEVGALCRDTGATIALLHHGIKRPQDPYRPMKLVDLSGAGVTEFARQWLLLSRRTEYDEERPGHHELWLRVGGSAFQGSLVGLDIEEFSEAGGLREWSATVRPASEVTGEIIETEQTRKRDQQEQRQQAALNAAETRWLPKAKKFLRRKENRAGVAANALRNGIGASGRLWAEVFALWVEAGVIVACTYEGANRRSYAGFQLPEFQQDKPDSTGFDRDSPANPAAPEGGSREKDSPPLEGDYPNPASPPLADHDDEPVPF